MADRELPAYAAAIRRARAECGWSRGRLAYELERTIRREGMEPPARESLIRMIRAWENGEHKPDNCNRERLIKVLGNRLRDYMDPPERTTATLPALSTRELKTVELVAWVADHSSMSFQEAYGAIAIRAERLLALPPANRHAEAHRRKRITREHIARALIAYYQSGLSGGDGATFYRARVGGIPLTLSILVEQGWLGTAVRLGSDQEEFRLANPGGAGLAALEGLALEAALVRLAGVEVSNTVLINNPLYRLLNIDITQRRLEATVALADFADYALTMDLLESELVNALAMGTRQASGNADLADVLQLPLRDSYLPTVASALAFGKRLCMGGPVALLAAARASTRYTQREPDYVLLVQERSTRVLNATGRLAVVPKAFHEPTIEATEEVRLSASLERELEEELLGREDLEGLTQGSYRLADPFHADRLSEPMQWLMTRRHTDAYRVECIGFGINMVTGNYEFPCLIMIDDDEWWARYGGQVEANWEMDRIRRYSSLDTAGLQALAVDPRWSNEGLFAFLEGLRRLAERGSLSRLALPKIELEA